MTRTLISAYCCVVCLIIYQSPPSTCAATAPTSTTLSQQQQQHDNEQQQLPDAQSPAASYEHHQATPQHAYNQDELTLLKSSRNKRELTEDGMQDVGVAKRLRSFVGKRYWDGKPQNSPSDFSTLSEYPGSNPFQLVVDPDDGNVYIRSPDDDDDDFVDNASDGLNEDGDVYSDIAKRIRSFIGKRAYSPSVMNGDADWLPEDDDQDVELSKRLRSFIGKRLRSFIGKRDGLDKRVRSFVGKRIRGFVGKRDREYDYGNDLVVQEKRPRSFIGKRPRVFIGKRIRSFIGKRSGDWASDSRLLQNLLHREDTDGADSIFSAFPDKRVRSFVGKRSYLDDLDSSDTLTPYTDTLTPHRDPLTPYTSYNDGFGMTADKRPRRFIGKRSMDALMEAQKRLRSFIGKREDKRLRTFVGKRFDHEQWGPFVANPGDVDFDVVSEPSKRLRSFVGKRSGRAVSEIESPVPTKRLRDFVGKRDSDMSKRLRSFVGRR